MANLILQVECSSEARKPYSGSKYPTVPLTMLETWDDPSTASFERPKSETFALMFLSRSILLVFRSLWMTAGTQPVWRYSIPEMIWKSRKSDCNAKMKGSAKINKWKKPKIRRSTPFQNTIMDLLLHKPFAASSAISRRLSQQMVLSWTNGPVKIHKGWVWAGSKLVQACNSLTAKWIVTTYRTVALLECHYA